MTQDELKLVFDALQECTTYAVAGGFGKRATAHRDALDILEKALAQEQEPVAWSISPAVKGEDGRLYAYTNEKEWALSLVSKGHEIRPLVHGDTTLLQRTWVGLFNEEIEVLFQTAAGADEEVHIRFARAIESKLKDKNS